MEATPKFETYIIDSVELFEDLESYVKELKPEYLVIDVETDSKIEKKANLYGIGLCFVDNEAFYIPWRNKNGEFIFSSIEQDYIVNWLRSISNFVKIIGHNVIYDILVLKNSLKLDLTNSIYSDTMLLKHSLEEEPPFKLKVIAKTYLGDWADKAQEELYANIEANSGSTNKDSIEMYKADTNILAEYCMWDVILTMKLFYLFSKRLKEEGLEKLFYQDEIMPLYKSCVIPMKDKGFPIDLEHFNKLNKDLELEINKLEDEIIKEVNTVVKDFISTLLEEEFPVKTTGNFPKALANLINVPLPETKEGKISLARKHILLALEKCPEHANFYKWILGEVDFKEFELFKRKTQEQLYFSKYSDRRNIFNLRSNNHLIYLLIEKLGYEPLDHTEKGKPQIDEDFIDSLKNDRPFIRKLKDFKKLNKLKSTYVEGILERQIDGIIYCDMLMSGTTSGRFSSSNPNLNNLPAQVSGDDLISKYTNAIRKGFISNKGYKIVGSDFDSLEPHLAAFVSKDEGLIDIFVTGKDFYSAIGVKQFNIKDARPYKDGKYDSFPVKYKELREKVKTYCFGENTKIETIEGIKDICKIKIGDEILTLGGFKKVLNVFKREAETIKFVTNKGGFYCTPDHKIWSKTANTWKEAKDFTINENLEYNKKKYKFSSKYLKLPIFSNASFKNGATSPISYLDFDEEWAWILGAYLGDGIGSYTRKKIYRKRNFNSHLISCNIGICGLPEDLVVKKFTEFFERKGYKSALVKIPNPKTGKILHTTKISDFELVKIFQSSFKMFVHKDKLSGRKNLKIQDFVFNSPTKVKLAFIAGLFDTDGYLKINRNKKSSDVAFCSREITLATDVVNLLESLGVDSRIIPEFNKTYKKYYYVVRVTSLGVWKLSKMGLGNYLICPRKKEAIDMRKNLKSPNTPKWANCILKHKENNEIINVFDITVEDIHEFYANNIRVHNCLASLYGSTAPRISQLLGCKVNEADNLLKGYFKAFPGVEKFVLKTHLEAVTKGYVKTAYGRIRHLSKAKEYYAAYGMRLTDYRWARERGKTKERAEFRNLLNNSVNFLIQGLGAHCLNRAMIEMTKRFVDNNLDARVVLSIHDEVLVHCREDQTNIVKIIMKDSMENCIDLGAVRLKANPIVGNSYGECK